MMTELSHSFQTRSANHRCHLLFMSIDIHQVALILSDSWLCFKLNFYNYSRKLFTEQTYINTKKRYTYNSWWISDDSLKYHELITNWYYFMPSSSGADLTRGARSTRADREMALILLILSIFYFVHRVSVGDWSFGECDSWHDDTSW